MLELFNFYPWHGYDKKANGEKINLTEYCQESHVDGVEMLVFERAILSEDFINKTYGVHLRYWPEWVGFWKGDLIRLDERFKNKTEIAEYYGTFLPSEWLNIITQNIKEALKLQPKYLVWHVSDANDTELYTRQFRYTDMDVVDATAEVFNEVSKNISSDICVLFENLWWPGLRLTDKKVVERFFGQIKRNNVGIMMDVGHLANTNLEISTQKELISYEIKVVQELGEYAKYIKGIHLSKSLSGEYVKKTLGSLPKEIDIATLYKHIVNIDQHQAFTDTDLEKLVQLVQPEFLVHELFYNNLDELKQYIKLQQIALGKCHFKEGE